MSSSALSNDEKPQRDVLYRTAQAIFVAAPVLMLLPPRRLDLNTFLLGSIFAASGARLYNQRQPDRAPLVTTQPPQGQIRHSHQGQKRLLEESDSAAQSKTAGTMLEQKAKEIWMGGETEGWKERRLREERERLAKGEGYGDMIMDQIWDVWTWGQKKAEDLKETDEQLLKRQQREREFPKIGND
jgi:hypothetical protein